MELTYIEAESTELPSAIVFDDGIVRIRINITSEERVIDEATNETLTYYNYEEAELSPEEFQVYSNYLMMQSLGVQIS